MKITIKLWPIRKLIDIQDRINPRPQFQRGEVWNLERKQLLIDSILRNYDLPKVYLSKNTTALQYDYDVADGQQRLRAIWDYFADVFSLGDKHQEIDGHNVSGLSFSGLPADFRNRLGDFKVTIALMEEATQDELRTLFARLQMGVVLIPVELRNAIASAIGSAINTTAETHDFFTQSRIGKSRFKRQDYLAHAVALAHYNNSEDLKAPLLARLYRDLAYGHSMTLMRKTYNVLDHLHKINQHAKLVVRNKWGFVDLFWFLFQENPASEAVDHAKLAKAFIKFEAERVANNRKPELLLQEGKKDLFDYIQAFNTSGAEKSNISIRNRIFVRVFKKFIKE